MSAQTVTQRGRVLAALQAHPDRGITQVDFALPQVIDGAAPITRVAARIDELRATGYPIADGGWRDSCRIYKLEGALEGADHGAPSLSLAPPPAPEGKVGALQPAPVPDGWPGRYHCCDACGHAWKGGHWPDECVSCRALPHWIASYHHPHDAQIHTAAGRPSQHHQLPAAA